MNYASRRRRLIAVCAAAVGAASVAVVVSVSAFAARANSDGSPIRFAARVGNVQAFTGTPSVVLSDVAAHLPLVSNTATTQVTIPASPGPSAAGAAVQGLRVTYDLAVNSTDGANISQALWEGDMFVGAAADEYYARGFGNLVDANGTLVTPDGGLQAIGGGVGHVVRGQIFASIPADIASSVSTAASGVGLHSVQVETLPVIQSALIIHAVSDSPASDVAAFRSQGGLDYLLGQPATNFEGVYFEIDDSAGNPVDIVWYAPRDGSSGWWAAPYLGLSDRETVSSTN